MKKSKFFNRVLDYAYMDELSEKIMPSINDIVSDYGLKCVSFALAGLDIDITKYDELDKSQVELISRTRGFQGDKAGLDILGKDWGRVKGVEVLKDLAQNPGTSEIASAGASLGLGIGAAGAFSSIADQVFAPVANEFSAGAAAPAQNAPAAQSAEDPVELLTKLKKMLDAGLIEQAEYDAKKAEILSRM